MFRGYAIWGWCTAGCHRRAAGWLAGWPLPPSPHPPHPTPPPTHIPPALAGAGTATRQRARARALARAMPPQAPRGAAAAASRGARRARARAGRGRAGRAGAEAGADVEALSGAFERCAARCTQGTPGWPRVAPNSLRSRGAHRRRSARSRLARGGDAPDAFTDPPGPARSTRWACCARLACYPCAPV